MKKTFVKLSIVALSILFNNINVQANNNADLNNSKSAISKNLSVDTEKSEVVWTASKVGGEHNGIRPTKSVLV